MPIQLTTEQLKFYFLGTAHHRAYAETVKEYNKLRTHADGITPEKLIKERRPSESEETMEYRKAIYVPKTKNPIGKVISSLSKIRRSPDWSIRYDEKAVPTKIIEGEKLDDYCEENYPGHTSITNWAFSVLLKIQCIDPNAVIAVLPTNIDAGKNNEYYKPIAYFFNSDQVLFYEEGAEYTILKSSERSSLVTPDINGNLPNAASVFYVVTITEYQKWEMTPTSEYAQTQQLTHNKGKMPVFKVRAQFLKQKENTIIQESRLSPMAPSLDEAAREYSDLQAAKVQHMYPLFWYYQSKNCNHCDGSGKTIVENKSSDCGQCGGSGKVKFSPYAHLAVEPPKMGSAAIPFSQPAGYIARDVDIIKHQEESVKNHLFDALAAINMQFLDQTPLNISGEAKSVDREELNNFVYTFAEDLIATLDQVYWWICEWRYATIVPDPLKRKAMLPQINVPEQFDLLPADYLMDGIGKAKNLKFNPLLIAAMEEDYADKAFYNFPEVAAQIRASYDLDPLPALSMDEKMSLISNNGITQEDYVTSAYISSFVKRAISEDEGFLAKPLAEKKRVISKYAQEKIQAVDDAEQMKQDLAKKEQQQQQEMFGQGG